jgi:NAD(P)-dependent dehydrogenase (short-subunit alcohol dehydrogenase family)
MAIILITGSSRGIGLATAVVLARSGHTVIATMRDPNSADELLRIVATERLSVTILALDTNDDNSVAQAFDRVHADHGRIDVLVNNAGISGPGPVDETPLDLFRQVMETNYFGALRCIKAVLPGMLARRTGCIVNVSSVAGRVAIAPQAPYAASKYALEALSECLAQEVRAFNVRVALVEPGPIATQSLDKVQRAQPKTDYPQLRRLAALFAAAMERPTLPSAAGDLIRQIVESNSWQLRYTVGPLAPLFIKWRAKTNDEDWVNLIAGNDSEWVASVKREMGLDLTL